VVGDVRESQAINRVLNVAFFDQLKMRRQARRSANRAAAPFSARELFEELVVRGFARDTITNTCADQYRMNVIEALKREASLDGRDWQAHIQDVVMLVAAQAKPFISVIDADVGSRLIYWALSPASRESCGEGSFYDQLFRYEEEESAIVEPQFADQELYCVNLHFNLPLDQLPKLVSRHAVATNINAPAEGRYEQAYRRRIGEIIEWAAHRPGEICPTLTPHLDRGWHRPGVLPELFREQADAESESLYRALVVLLGMGLVRREVGTEGDVLAFYDPTRKAQGNNRSVIASGHGAGVLLKTLRSRPDVVLSATGGWASILAEVPVSARGSEESFRGLEPVTRLTDPSLMADLLTLARERGRAEADTDAAAAVAAQLRLLRELIETLRSDLDRDGRRRTFARLGGDLADAALTEVRNRSLLTPDTLAMVQPIPRNILEHMLESWT
jgi:hypothetical protein